MQHYIERRNKMNEIQIFNSPEFGQVRSLVINGEPWLVGKDVTKALGYDNPSKAIRDHVEEEDKRVGVQNVTPYIIDSLGRKQHPTFINESGLYALVFGSKLPSAKKFKRWVTSEVLPSLRKTGQYQVKELSGSELMAKALIEAQNVLAAKDKQIEEMKPKVVFADAVATSHTSILVGELAKILKQNGIDMGQKRLFAWLREKGYLIKRQGTDYNMPTQKAMDLGLFEIKEGSYVNGSGVNITTKTPKVTGKGQQYFINKFLAKE
jgi:anti-repressor protein